MPLDGKTTWVFSGRIHHFQKLSCVVDRLRELGCDARYYISDNAIGLDNAVEYLIPNSQPFIHALDFLDVNATQRTTEMTHDILEKIEAHNERESDIRNYVNPFWLSYSVREACEFIVATENALDQLKPDVVIVLHQQNFWTRPLGYLANRRGIPVVSFQEGRLRYRDEKTLNKQATAADDCQKLFCWSESARQAYIEAGIPESKLAVTGIPHLEQWFGYMANKETWPLIACSDMVISQLSTVAIETLALNVPLAELDLDHIGILESLAEQGVAIPIGGGELSKIKQVLSGELRIGENKLGEWLEFNIGPRDAGIVNRVVAEIERLII